MIPGSFDIITAREITGDEQARALEAKARRDADTAAFSPPSIEGITYWDKVCSQMRYVVYTHQYEKRLARNKRKGDCV